MDSDIDAFYEESRRLDETLLGDLESASKHLGLEDTQFWRRTYCRCLMTAFEGIVQDLKKHTLYFYDAMLGDDEKDVLRKRLGALEGAFHAFDLYTNVAGATTPLERESQEWLILKKAIKIRNRITHPESADDLELSAQDMIHLKATAKVLFDLICTCHEDTGKALKKRGELLLKAWEKAERRTKQCR